MSEQKQLFKVPISTGGDFTCTLAADRVYLLSFTSPPDNRLTPPFITAFLLALDLVEHRLPKGVLVTTSAIAKFYSNGLNLDIVAATPAFLSKYLYRLFQRLLTYPMPTVALINGHNFAGGLMVAMYHDYRIMNPSKGFLCLNEVLFGAVMDSAMVSIFRQKIPKPITFRILVLEGKRFGGQQALDEGIVDDLGGLEAVLRLVDTRELITKGDAGVYGGLKEEMYRESYNFLVGHEGNLGWRRAVEERKEVAASDAEDRVADFETANGAVKAKL